MRLKHIVLSVSILLVTLSFYISVIYKNQVLFMSDEMYWISTSRVVQMLWKGDFNNPEWKEYYGFANLNGAKFIYGIGLAIAGHTDTRITGVAPATYYRWTDLEPGHFPKSHAAYPLLRDARVISALFTAMAVALLYTLAILMHIPVVAAVAAALIMGIHPVTKHVATHAFSDGIFLFFQMLLLISLFWRWGENRHSHLPQIITGVLLACLVSVKINGAIFIPVIFFLTIMRPNRQPHQSESIHMLEKRLGVITAATLLTLVLLHPNFIFYPDYSPLQLLSDRARITAEHVAYYSHIDPSHVILRPAERILSLMRHSFPLWLGALSIVGALVTLIHANSKSGRNSAYLLFLTSGAVITLSVLAYCVFDEPRYYLPILPFIAVLAGYSATLFPTKKHR